MSRICHMKLEMGKIQYGIKYEFAPKSCEDIFRMVRKLYLRMKSMMRI